MANLSKHFTTEEFQCHHCGLLVKIDEELLLKLEKLRTLLKVPIKINSGYRCPEHNAEIGGAVGSYHIKGMAADIFAAGYRPAEIAEIAKMVGFNGIGIYENWLHVDTRENFTVWKK